MCLDTWKVRSDLIEIVKIINGCYDRIPEILE